MRYCQPHRSPPNPSPPATQPPVRTNDPASAPPASRASPPPPPPCPLRLMGPYAALPGYPRLPMVPARLGTQLPPWRAKPLCSARTRTVPYTPRCACCGRLEAEQGGLAAAAVAPRLRGQQGPGGAQGRREAAAAASHRYEGPSDGDECGVTSVARTGAAHAMCGSRPRDGNGGTLPMRVAVCAPPYRALRVRRGSRFGP